VAAVATQPFEVIKTMRIIDGSNTIRDKTIPFYKRWLKTYGSIIIQSY